jgi:asparagine synthase (glutamine-hydrolysing)
VASYVRQAKIPLPDRLQSYNYLHRHSPGTVFCDTFLQRVDTHAPLQQIRDEYSVHSYADSIDRMLFLDWKFTLHDNDLVKVNTACRLAGIDVAYPMLDPSLMRFSCQIPGPLKMYRGRLRWFYKHAFRDFLPEPIINKKKHGFGLPFGVWMKTEPRLRELSRQALASMSARGVFREDFLNELMRLHEQEAAAYYGELVWTLTTLELWLQAHAPQFAV